MTRELITQMLEAMDSGAMLDDGSIDTDYLDAITAAREYLAVPEQEPVAYLAWRDGKPCYDADDAVCEDAVWPVDGDDDRTSMPVSLHPAPEPVNQMLLEALKMALHQNEHDMVMTGAECRKCAAAIAQAEQAPQSTELTDDYLDPFVDVVYKHWQDPTTFDHGVIRADFRAAFDSHKFTTPEDMKNQVDMQVEINQQKEHITRLERSYRELRAMLATSQKDVSKLQKQLKETK